MRAVVGDLPLEMKVDAIETRAALWGDQLVRHIDLPPGVDLRPLLEGLPGDMCQCPHWGMVLAGSIHLRFADGSEEIVGAGEAYYWPAGHVAWTDEGVQFLEFSLETEIRPVLDHLAAQLAAGA